MFENGNTSGSRRMPRMSCLKARCLLSGNCSLPNQGRICPHSSVYCFWRQKKSAEALVAISPTRICSESVTPAVEQKEEEHEEHLHDPLGSRPSLGPGHDGTRTTLLDGTCCLYGSALCQRDGDHGWTLYRWDRVPGLGGSRGGERGQD